MTAYLGGKHCMEFGPPPDHVVTSAAKIKQTNVGHFYVDPWHRAKGEIFAVQHRTIGFMLDVKASYISIERHV